MFTGLVEGQGTIARVKPLGGGIRLSIRARWAARQLRISDSVAINGCCQTVVKRSATEFEVVAVEETLRKTTLGLMKKGESVNLELPLPADGRLGGHFVLGHVDTVGTVVAVEERMTSTMFRIEIPAEFVRYVVPVGSIAVDGVSLTLAEVEENRCGVSIIPHTLEKTLFGRYSAGARVNIEFDILGKYIERLSGTASPRGGVFDEAKLREHGY